MTAAQTPAASNRLNSIDFMRAFVVFIMIFVNDLARFFLPTRFF